MANEVIGIEVAVKLDQLRTQLATLGPGMEKEAAAMTAALNKQLKAQTAAVKQQTAAMNAAQKSGFKQIGDDAAAAGTKFDKLGKAMGPLGGVLSRISPEAGAAASSVAGLTTAFEGVTAAGITMEVALPIVAAIAAAVALGSLAWQGYNHEAEVASQLAEIHRVGLEAQAPLDKALILAKLDLAQATHELSVQEVQYQKVAYGSQARIDAELKPLKEQAKALKINREGWDGVMDAGEQYLDSVLLLIPGSVSSYSKSLDENEAALAANAEEQQAVIAKAKALRITLQEVDKATFDNANTKHKATKQSADDEAAADAKIAAIMEEDAHRIELRDQHREESAQRQLKAHNDELKEIADRAAAEAKADEARAKAAKVRIDQEQSYQDAAMTVAHSVAGLADRQLQNQIDSLDTSTKAGKAAAKELWEQQLALGIAMAVLDAARAVSAASTLPPPASFVAMGVAAAVGAVNIAAIASTPPPKFHMGTNEVNATLTRGEAVLTGAAADKIGRGTINDLNSGRGTGAQSITVVQAVDHRVFHRTVRDNLALNGPLYKATSAASGVPVGHRSSR